MLHIVPISVLGIYGLFRHPSYVGWFLWSVGSQAGHLECRLYMLKNCLLHLGSLPQNYEYEQEILYDIVHDSVFYGLK